MPEQLKPHWLRTPNAALYLGVSPQYLKKCRDCYDDGFLKEEEHYVLGANFNSSILWNVQEVLKAFHHRGKIHRLGTQVIAEIGAKK
tara:strand:- start:84 stop:344 length:261 start_codon:yes stop_codon:yes gene_type:complete